MSLYFLDDLIIDLVLSAFPSIFNDVTVMPFTELKHTKTYRNIH